jgi:hypothetical protein
MPSFLGPLLHDLAERYRFLDQELAGLQLPPEAEGCRKRIHHLVQRGKRQIDRVLLDPDMNRRDFAKNFYHSYKRLSELAQGVDEGPLLVFSRFREGDRFLTRVIAKMCRDSGFPHEAPVCAAMSSQYYWTVPGMDLVLVPHADATHLLGWPDLYHELAHFLVARDERILLRPLRRRVRDYFKRAISEAGRNGWPAPAIADLRRYRDLWLDDWIVEFICDWFATFVAGPSFGWTNLRLCARVSTDVFNVFETHPSDAARTLAIHVMLESVGFGNEASEITNRWNEMLRTAGAAEPQFFKAAYPETLMRDLSDEAARLFGVLGIKRCTCSSGTLPELLNEAWSQLHSDGSSFSAWERDRLSQLEREL